MRMAMNLTGDVSEIYEWRVGYVKDLMLEDPEHIGVTWDDDENGDESYWQCVRKIPQNSSNQDDSSNQDGDGENITKEENEIKEELEAEAEQSDEKLGANAGTDEEKKAADEEKEEQEDKEEAAAEKTNEAAAKAALKGE